MNAVLPGSLIRPLAARAKPCGPSATLVARTSMAHVPAWGSAMRTRSTGLRTSENSPGKVSCSSAVGAARVLKLLPEYTVASGAVTIRSRLLTCTAVPAGSDPGASVKARETDSGSPSAMSTW